MEKENSVVSGFVRERDLSVWVLTLMSLVTMPISYFISIEYVIQFSMASFVVYVCLLLWDRTVLKKHGLQHPNILWAIIFPVYVWRRCDKNRLSLAPFFVSVALFIGAMFMPTPQYASDDGFDVTVTSSVESEWVEYESVEDFEDGKPVVEAPAAVEPPAAPEVKAAE